MKLHWLDPFAAELGETAAADRISAPMPGTIIRILAEAGAVLTAGAPILVLEAMKMEHTLRAPFAGVVSELPVSTGTQVVEGAPIMVLEPLETSAE